MLHPSYSDLMNVVNSNVEEGEEPVVNSRYSIVMATAKRARPVSYTHLDVYKRQGLCGIFCAGDPVESHYGRGDEGPAQGNTSY